MVSPEHCFNEEPSQYSPFEWFFCILNRLPVWILWLLKSELSGFLDEILRFSLIHQILWLSIIFLCNFMIFPNIRAQFHHFSSNLSRFAWIQKSKRHWIPQFALNFSEIALFCTSPASQIVTDSTKPANRYGKMTTTNSSGVAFQPNRKTPNCKCKRI